MDLIPSSVLIAVFAHRQIENATQQGDENNNNNPKQSAVIFQHMVLQAMDNTINVCC